MSASISWSRATTGCRIGFTQIAGLVARRILPFVKEGDVVAAGERVGLIRFGSRVDVYLPAGTALAGAARPAHDRRRDDHRARSASIRSCDGRQPVSERRRRAARHSAARGRSQCDHRAGLVLRPDRRPLRHRRANGRRRSAAIVVAGVLDGFDGRIARLLQGAEQVRRRAGFAVATISPSGLRRR